MSAQENVLTDVCCGPCAIPLVDNPELKVVFYLTNSNVHPFSEYVKRLQAIRQVSKYYKNDLIIDSYNPKEWMDFVKGFELEKEGGKRCELCYRFRLEKTAMYAKDHGYKKFTTTLTTGPGKKAETINQIGKEIAAKYGLEFIELDLKRKGGFLKSISMSKKLGLYRQTYCGCIYSLRDMQQKSMKKTRVMEKLQVKE